MLYFLQQVMPIFVDTDSGPVEPKAALALLIVSNAILFGCYIVRAIQYYCVKSPYINYDNYEYSLYEMLFDEDSWVVVVNATFACVNGFAVIVMLVIWVKNLL